MNKLKIIFIVMVLPIILLIYFVYNNLSKESGKILHIASYHEDFDWTANINKGIKSLIEQTSYDYKVFYMDTKRKNNPKNIQSSANIAKNIIKNWNPDVIITSDDNATKYIASTMIDTNYKFVFSGVNAEPDIYGFPTTNITGIIERKPVFETINTLKSILPNLNQIVILGGDSTSSRYDLEQFLNGLKKFPDIKINEVYLSNSYEKLRQKVTYYDKKIDLFIFVPLSTIKDKNNKPIPNNKIIKWIANNSTTPELGTNEMMAKYGGFMSSTPDAFEQGLNAAKYALKIIRGESPSTMPILPTLKPKIIINKSRAKNLNIKIQKKSNASFIVIE